MRKTFSLNLWPLLNGGFLYLASPPTKEKVESLDTLLASVRESTDIPGFHVMVPMKVDQANQTDPQPPYLKNPPPAPPLPMVSEDNYPFHYTAVLQRPVPWKDVSVLGARRQSTFRGRSRTMPIARRTRRWTVDVLLPRSAARRSHPEPCFAACGKCLIELP